MDLRQLRYFVAVATHGSVTAAAAELNVSQPALSAQIHNLERELQTVLLDRHSRGVTLTHAGKLLWERGTDILADVDSLARSVTEHGRSVTGVFRVGVTPTVGRVLVPEMARLCALRFPALRLSYVEGYSDDLRDQLRAGKLNLVFSYDMDEDSSLHATPLISEDLYLVGSPDLIGHEVTPIAFSELRNFPLIQEMQSHYTTQLLTALSKRKRIPLNLSYEVDSVSVRRTMLASRSTATIAFYGLFHDEISSNILNARQIVSPALTRRLDLLRKGGTLRDRNDQDVAGLIREIVAEQLHRQTYRWRPA
jgi:LysR family nitrogen assimilation transcriptional regulator